MATRNRWGMWLIVYVVPVVLVFVLAFAFLSAPFTPPADGEPPAIVRHYPLAHSTAQRSQPPTAEPAVDSVEGAPVPDSAWISSVIDDFYARNDGAPESLEMYALWVRRDFFDIAYVVLEGNEPHDTLMHLIADPDESVRIAAMKALGEAQNALQSNGYPATLRLLRNLDPQQTDAMVAAACETIIEQTHNGEQSHMQGILHLIGEPGLVALPHLVWVSDHHPEPGMRTGVANTAWFIAPDSHEVNALLQRRMFDPNGLVRLNALQSIAIDFIAGIAGHEELGPPTATSESADMIVIMHEGEKNLAGEPS